MYMRDVCQRLFIFNDSHAITSNVNGKLIFHSPNAVCETLVLSFIAQLDANLNWLARCLPAYPFALSFPYIAFVYVAVAISFTRYCFCIGYFVTRLKSVSLLLPFPLPLLSFTCFVVVVVASIHYLPNMLVCYQRYRSAISFVTRKL